MRPKLQQPANVFPLGPRIHLASLKEAASKLLDSAAQKLCQSYISGL
jgi:hypothetical protein